MSEATDFNFDRASLTPEAIAARLAVERRLRVVKHRPANTLYVRPNLDFYQEQARRLHKAQPSSKLHAAQLTVARGVGFPSWPKLVAALRARERAANDLSESLARRDHDAILRIAREHPLALLDAGCVASLDELQLLLRIVPMRRHEPDMLTDLLDAVAEHHKPQGLEECVGMLMNSGADPFHAYDIIEERRERAAASPKGEQAVEMFENALGVLAWVVDEPEDGYMSKD